jgi:hypothetical protein
MEKKYHIYINGKCLDHNLSFEEFKKLWNNYSYFADIYKDFEKADLTFEEVIDNKIEYSLEGSINNTASEIH